MDEHKERSLYDSVAQLLFTPTRCRKEIQTAVSLLTTRIRAPGEDNWKNFNDCCNI